MMIMDTLRGLTLHGPGSPPTSHLPSFEEFIAYVNWPGGHDQFGRGGEAEDNKVEKEEQIFRNLYE